MNVMQVRQIARSYGVEIQEEVNQVICGSVLLELDVMGEIDTSAQEVEAAMVESIVGIL